MGFHTTSFDRIRFSLSGGHLHTETHRFLERRRHHNWPALSVGVDWSETSEWAIQEQDENSYSSWTACGNTSFLIDRCLVWFFTARLLKAWITLIQN